MQVHRVVPKFVMQDGDPRGDGDGKAGPVTRFAIELSERPYLRGTVGWRVGKDTGGSQFFTPTHRSRTSTGAIGLGHVVNGMDVVESDPGRGHDRADSGWDGKGE